MPEVRRCRLAELLTAELLIQILIRLPLDSLMVCRRVCKSWKDLIVEPFFLELQRSFSRTPPTIMLVYQAVQELEQPIEFGFITESSSCQYDVNYTDEEIEIPEIEMVGSCNGLVCLSSFDYEYYESFDSDTGLNADNHRLFLCNPVIGSQSYIPDPPRVSDSEYCRRSQFGFGYVPSTNQYKAVKIVYQKPRKKQRRRLLFHVYTIPSGNKKQKKRKYPWLTSPWRTIHFEDGSFSGPGLREISDSFSYPTCFKGSIIWIADSPKEMAHSLVYFDLEKEQLQILPLPPTTIRRGYHSIGVYYDDDGSDHLYLCQAVDACANIWLMEDYKAIDSLKLKWVIQLPPSVQFYDEKPMQLFKVLKDGKLLTGVQEDVREWSLAHYDPNTKVLETVQNVQLRSDTFLAADTPNLLGCLL